MNVSRRLAQLSVFLLVSSLVPAQQPESTTSPAPAQQSTPTVPAPGTPPSTAPNGQAAALPSATNTIRTTARLVILDAVVVDKKGNAVPDLTREQFQVKEDGADQAVLNFTPPGRYNASADMTIDSTAA